MAATVAAVAEPERVDADSGAGGCLAAASASHTSWVVKLHSNIWSLIFRIGVLGPIIL